MPSRRLDDRIRSLSHQVIGASPAELNEILPKLLAAIHEKMERLRALAADRFLGGRTRSERATGPDSKGCTPGVNISSLPIAFV